MIAQMLAARHPERVRSLTSIMSTPAASIGAPTREATQVLLRAAPRSRAEAVERSVETYRVIGSPGYPMDEERLRAVAAESYDRAHDPVGVMRQLAAIWASGDRRDALRRIHVPTLVVHGDADPLVQPAGGRATAEAVADAELVTYPEMGHDLPRALWGDIVARIAALARRADRLRDQRAG